MRFFPILAAIIAVSGLGTLGHIADTQAQQWGSGDTIVVRGDTTVSVNGMRFGLDPGMNRAIQVRVMDDSPSMVRLKDWIEAGLVRRGFQLGGNDSPLIFTVDSSSAAANPVDGTNRTLPLLLYGQAGGTRGEDDVRVGVRVFSNNEASLLGGRASRDQMSISNPGVRIQASLSERRGGKQLWVGWAQVGETTMSDNDKLLLMAAPLVKEVGGPNNKQTITLTAGTTLSK